MYTHVRVSVRYETLEQFLVVHSEQLTNDQVETLRSLNKFGSALDQFDWDFNVSDKAFYLTQKNTDARVQSILSIYLDGKCDAYMRQIGKARVQYIDFLSCLLFLNSNRAGKHIDNP